MGLAYLMFCGKVISFLDGYDRNKHKPAVKQK